jgi:hypothetical protein
MVEVKYFKDIDTDAVYACVGPMGVNAMFRLSRPLANDVTWEFLVPSSPIWDAVHQRIYRNPRVEAVTAQESEPPLPPLPDIPRGPFPEWKEYFLPERPIDVSRYPSVGRFLRGQRKGRVTVSVLLHEDRYETALGDGEFHYFQGVFLSGEEAQSYMDQNRGEWDVLHVRTMSIQLEHGKFTFPDFSPERYDRYRAEEVLEALEACLQS